MKIASLLALGLPFSRAGLLCAALALLAGCGAYTTSPNPSVAVVRARDAHSAQRDSGGSWMASNASTMDLLYVSDISGKAVYVYAYPDGTPEGELTGFNGPSGLCVDASGNVFITEEHAARIVVYPHGSTERLATLLDGAESPGDCSVDPTTGDLAVTNISGPYSQPGNVALYKNATGLPKHYRDAGINYYQFCGYDPKGDLFVDGVQNGVFRLVKIPHGKHRFTNITVHPTINFPGAVQWDGKTLAVGDYKSKLIYRFHITGNHATVVGITQLHHSSFAIGFWIDGSTVVGPNDDSANVMFWRYPRGGSETKTIEGLKNPWGATVSRASSQR